VPEARPDDHEGKRVFGVSQEQKTFDSGYVAPHPGIARDVLATAPPEVKESYMEHHIWYDKAYLESVHPVHLPPKNLADRVGLAAVRFMRSCFDRATGYGPNMTEAKWLQRTIFLETVAGVPGMVAGMLRHLRSLRAFRTDKGWIHCLLEEAENERMHLLTFLQMRQPGALFRFFVIGAQGVFFNLYFIVYLLWPKVCHSFVGYLEEEAVRTYTHLISDIDNNKVWKNKPAPKIAKEYWCLPEDATMRDLILAVRADEACHSHVNHTLKTLAPDDPNPFVMGKSQAP
ncbi:alternative oxidase 2, partial [Dunaliella salina]